MIYAIINHTQAGAIVIYDNTSISKSIQSFYEFVPPTQGTKLLPVPKLDSTRFSFSQFPVKTPAMTLGKVSEQPLKYSVPTPLCLVGSDKTSLKWLQVNYQYLTKIATTCLLVEVATKQQFTSIQKNYPNIDFVAVSASDIAVQLNLKHYPVLIYQKEVIQ